MADPTDFDLLTRFNEVMDHDFSTPEQQRTNVLVDAVIKELVRVLS